MKFISEKEIIELYEKCGIDANNVLEINNELNNGSLENKLNSNYSFLTQGLFETIWSGHTNVDNK